MDKLQRCIEVLRGLSPDDAVVGNRTYAAELPVNHFISKELQTLLSSLERLRKAVRKEAEKNPSDSAFWNDDVLEYVETLLRKASDLTERRLPPPNNSS
jgi:hypothetical protein